MADGALTTNVTQFVHGASVTSPLILDLDGDGVESTAMSAGTMFDIDGDGDLDHAGWVGKDDGLLVRDINRDGQIDDGSELFGNNTELADGIKADDGFGALEQFDGNKDGKIDNTDSIWEELKIWRDSDGDGKVGEGEMMTLEQAGVKSMNLGYEASDKVEDGNLHSMEGSYEKTDGTATEMTDVWFTMDTLMDSSAGINIDLSALDTTKVVNHDTNDTLDLSGWTNTTTDATVNGVVYDIYQNDTNPTAFIATHVV